MSNLNCQCCKSESPKWGYIFLIFLVLCFFSPTLVSPFISKHENQKEIVEMIIYQRNKELSMGIDPENAFNGNDIIEYIQNN